LLGRRRYDEQLNFDLPGRNKHVVRMNPAWPSGLYHAIFQYGDGSSTSKNFSVE